MPGTLHFMVGGNQAIFDFARPYFKCMGETVSLCGQIVAGQAVRLMNIMNVVQTVHAIAEALKLARQSGVVDEKILFGSLKSGSTDSFVFRNHGVNSMLPKLQPIRDIPGPLYHERSGLCLRIGQILWGKESSAQSTMNLLNTQKI